MAPDGRVAHMLMKILLVTVNWDLVGGGGLARFSKGVVQGLRELDHTVDVLIEDKQATAADDAAILTVNSAASPLGRAWAFARGIVRYHKGRHYDAIICTTWSPGGTAAYLCHKWTGLPYWVMCHGNDVVEPQRSFFYAWLMARVLNGAQGSLCNSRYTSRLVEQLGIAEDKIAVIGCGIDPDYLSQFVPPQAVLPAIDEHEHAIVLTVGRLVARKGQDMTIRALALITHKNPECRYIIVGEGPDRERLERLSRDLNVEENVVFTGFMSDAGVYALIQKCHVFVMASRDIREEGEVEGFGIVFLEAGYFEKPVIAGNAGGMADPVADDVSGFIVDARSPEEIADKIVRLLDNKDLSTEMGRAGRRRTLEEFTWNKVALRVHRALTAHGESHQ